MKLTRAKKRLAIAALIVAAVLCISWYRHRRYELQFVGHWVEAKHAGTSDSTELPRLYGFSLFEDGTGFCRQGVEGSTLLSVMPLQWWTRGDRLFVNLLFVEARMTWRDRLTLSWWRISGETNELIQAFPITFEPTLGIAVPDASLVQLAIAVSADDRRMDAAVAREQINQMKEIMADPKKALESYDMLLNGDVGAETSSSNP